jgi:hypothetical protein
MYGCAGDRPFLREHHMTLPEFLQIVRDTAMMTVPSLTP